MPNVRYDIDHELVCDLFAKKIKQNIFFADYRIKQAAKNIESWESDKSNWVRKPSTPKWEENFRDQSIRQEYEYYSKVRVIQLRKGKYVLVYGDEIDAEVTSGTGPFTSIARAKDWFLNGGR